MKRILGLVLSFFICGNAFAQVSIGGLVGLGMSPELAKYFYDNGIALTTTANNAWIVAANATPAGATVKMIKVDATNNTHLNALTGKAIKLDVNLTPVAQVDANGLTSVSNSFLLSAPTSIPLSAGAGNTPIAQIQSDGLSFTSALSGVILPAAAVVTPFVTYAAGSATLTQKNSIIAAGAPTSAFVELPAATANVGKTLRIYNQGSNPVAVVPASGVINVAGALTPYSCSTLSLCQCEGLTTGVWGCTKAAW